MTFREYVAQLFPNDTAIVDNWSDKDLIDWYDDLYDKWFVNGSELDPFDVFYRTSGISDWVGEDDAKQIWDFQQAKINKALSFTDDVHSENWQESINCIKEVLK